MEDWGIGASAIGKAAPLHKNRITQTSRPRVRDGLDQLKQQSGAIRWRRAPTTAVACGACAGAIRGEMQPDTGSFANLALNRNVAAIQFETERPRISWASRMEAV